MKKTIIYGISAALMFSAGSYYQKKQFDSEVSEQKYTTFQENNQWYLSTPEGKKIINKNHEVGNVEERMRGLLQEKYENLKNSLEKILDKD